MADIRGTGDFPAIHTITLEAVVPHGSTQDQLRLRVLACVALHGLAHRSFYRDAACTRVHGREGYNDSVGTTSYVARYRPDLQVIRLVCTTG